MDYYEIIKKLIGPINPIGETNEDDKRFQNLEEIILLANALLYDIDQVAIHNKDRDEYSMKRAGECASRFLTEIQEI